ncbi:MAG: imelysin family protein [Pseudomonadota bacterium]
MRAAFFILLTCLPGAAAAETRLAPQDAALLQEALVTTADTFILPAYEAQSEAADELVTALGAYCASEAPLDPVHTSFADLFLAWQRSSIVGLGPIAEAEGPMRVQLWPDPKGFSARATRAASASADPSLLAPGGLDGRSIALTNLTALEGLIHEPVAPGSFGCDLTVAIAGFQADLAIGLVSAWTPGSDYRALFDDPGVENPRYASVDDQVRDLLAGAVVYVDRLRKFKLLRGMGSAPGEARAERTEAAASGLGRESIATAFAALADLYDTPFGLFDMAPEIGGSLEYIVLSQTAVSLATDVTLMDASLTDIAREDGQHAQDLRRMADAVLFQERFLKTGFLSSIGLTAGFTSADGD